MGVVEKKSSLVTGYDVLKAVKQAGRSPKHASDVFDGAGRDKRSAGPERPVPLSQRGRRIGSTVLPSRRDIICYACGYEFQVIGQAHSTICSKCRTDLDLVDYTIDAEWSETLLTVGTITLTSSGVLKGGELIGQNVVLEGKVEEGATIKAAGKLEIGPKASFLEGHVEGRDLRILPGALVTLRRKCTFRDVQVEGTLRARVVALERLIVKEGGLLQGTASSPVLVVEDGGGLIGKAEIVTREELDDESQLFEGSVLQLT